MKKAVLLSIKPKYCELIASGKKTVEIRKNRPKIDVPFKVYIYCTNTKPYLVWGDVFRGNWETEFTSLSGYSRKEAEKIWDVFNGKVIGEFVCDWINCINPLEPDGVYYLLDSCMDAVDFIDYSGGKMIYAWHISDLVIYDKPKKLSEFKKYDSECLWRSIQENGCKDIDGNKCRDCYLQRPPQSWCYVEELEE